ncbi:TetR/AcrR family transcriptional regulator [Actinocatenispora sera]|uniref:TetR family transcriptional regulator n=1 Tax=Actinocatenispora sera TaxID=390989 RepID=A0A810LAD4_9ACTN|nr:TetR/AcrR family transcriptional regulator [Actinocatenispora sera]BCJ30988.1 TetR family transcriptional regulator [Actinocatenispora sera]
MAGSASRRRAGLSRDRVFEAALRIADAEGVEALSMRRLGRELGVEAMSLYHHVPDKAAIVAGLAGRVFAEVTVPTADPAADWRTVLGRLLWSLRGTLLRHPGALPAVATHEVTAGPGLALYEAAMRLLHDAGFDLARANYALNNLVTYTIGHCLAMAGRPPLGVAEPTAAQRRETAAALDPDRYPTVAAWLAQLGDTGYDADALYEQGLTALLDGLAEPHGHG